MKLIFMIGFFAYLSIFSSTVSAKTFEDECARDSDCVNHVQELGRVNFEILREIRDKYIEAIEFQKLLDAFRSGGIQYVFDMLDLYSEYVTAAKRIDFEKESGTFGGVGIKFRMQNNKFTVVGFLGGKPAIKSQKIQEGDIIVAVDYKSTVGADRDTVSNWIRGEVGTQVILQLIRGGDAPAEITLALIREPIENLTTLIIGNIEYLGLAEFNKGASVSVKAAISDFPQSVKGLILDLRGNPGGLLSEAHKVAALFLELTELIEKVIGRDRVHRSIGASGRTPQSVKVTFPMAVLVDEYSASAAEIVAAALQDNQRAKIIGREATYGKGVTQTMYGYFENDKKWLELLNGDYFVLTTGFIQTPSGRILHNSGVTPDIIISDDEKDCEEYKEQAYSILKEDPQFCAAYKFLSKSDKEVKHATP